MFDIWEYLFHVAPVVFVMGVGICVLWRHVTDLQAKVHERDMANLKTLEQMLSVLATLDQKGDRNFNELREHINRCISELREDLRNRGAFMPNPSGNS